MTTQRCNRCRPAAATMVLAWVIGCGAAHAQDVQAVQRGQAAYDYHCAPCHGAGLGDDGRAMLPGTAALQIKYGGTLPALLEERGDLTAAALRVFVRQGSWSMPPFRPTEVTDADIEDIAAYIAASATAAAEAPE